ncbi:hypothetical protein [Pedobacter sp.]
MNTKDNNVSSNMKILTLIIKQTFFDQIVSGEKKNEYREIRPSNAQKYVIEDGENVEPVKYDAIRFYAGYNKDRATALFAVKNALIEILEDEEGNDIVYEENGQEYVMAQMNYELGDKIE